MRQWTVDAFANAPFKGNPACVVEPFDAWPADAWMQSLAAENNQAETAYLLKTDDPARFGLRWCTPAIEVPLCGHATLAAAHVLFAELGLGAETVTFDTKSGPLIVRRTEAGYEMDFPSQPPQRIDPPPALAKALGQTPGEVWVSSYMAVVLADEAAVRAVKPDVHLLKDIVTDTIGGRGNLGVLAPADAGKPYGVVSRFFAPGSGIAEDPATGSWHCIIAPLMADKLGRQPLNYHQAYPTRGGDLQCEVRGDRVLMRGAAVTVVESRLRL